MNPEDIFKQAFGGAFDFESIFGNQFNNQRTQQPRNRVSSISEIFLQSFVMVVKKCDKFLMSL